jgi:hypothetical protein
VKSRPARQWPGDNGDIEENKEMSGNKVQEAKITIETPLEKIVEYSDEGRKLVFGIEPGEFPEIPEEYVLRLSRANKESYLLAKRYHEDRMENASDEEFYADIVVGENMGNARARLGVEGLPENLAHRWVRPDRVKHYKQRGWTVYEGSDVETLSQKNAKGVRTISNMGVREHYLMVIDKDVLAANGRKRRERIEARFKSPENTARKEFGSSAVDEQTASKVNFSTAVGSEEE